MIWRYHFVQCVPVCISPVAVRLRYMRGRHLAPETRFPRRPEDDRGGRRRVALGLEQLMVGRHNHRASLLGEG